MKAFNKIMTKGGFTLIELLVVISIIGLLASIVLASLNTARAKARDAQRTISIHSVQSALELYYFDNGQYPASVDVAFPGILTASLTPKYMPSIPVDPKGGVYHYFTNDPGYPPTWYAIYIPYETKATCYVCAGPSNYCVATGYWGVNRC